MCCRRWTVLAIVLIARAHARPGDNDIKQNIPKHSEVACEKACEDLSPVAVEKLKVVETPVNERYPHAVLFGGTCGGSIIHPKWILTAGHCTLFTGGRYVVAGTNNTEIGGVTRYVKRLVVHPLFTVGPYWLDADQFNIKQVAARWDFLLAELDEPLPLDGKTMMAVNLDDQTSIPVGLDVDYAGYGTDHHGVSIFEHFQSTSNWSSFPSSVFPATYNLGLFKRTVNRLLTGKRAPSSASS